MDANPREEDIMSSPRLYGQVEVERKLKFFREDEQDPFGSPHSTTIVLCSTPDGEKWSVWEYTVNHRLQRGNPWKRKSLEYMPFEQALKRFESLTNSSSSSQG